MSRYLVNARNRLVSPRRLYLPKRLYLKGVPVDCISSGDCISPEDCISPGGCISKEVVSPQEIVSLQVSFNCAAWDGVLNGCCCCKAWLAVTYAVDRGTQKSQRHMRCKELFEFLSLDPTSPKVSNVLLVLFITLVSLLSHVSF